MIELKVNQTIRSLFAGLDEREIYDELEKDIQKRGILVKGVVANSPEEYKGTIVCGDKRHTLATKLGKEFPYILEEFKDFEEIMEYAKNDNLLRRQLTPAQKLKVESNYIEWLRKTRQEHVDIRGVSSDTPIGNTRELLAEKVGMSPATAQRALYVIENATDEVKKDMYSGETSISGAYKKVKKTKEKGEKDKKDNLIKKFNFDSGVEWCDYGINIYEGCFHNCTYCYAKLMNDRFKWVEVWNEPKKRNLDLVAWEKALEGIPPGVFFFCSTCDAYQPLNKTLKWAREVLQVMLKSKHHILILTKSSDVEDDFDLISQYKNVEVGFTITSLDDITYKKYEPNSSLPSEKVRVLKKAKEMGIKTLVSIEPWIIGHTDPLEIIKQLHPFVDRWIVGVANYMGFQLESYRVYVPTLITYLIENNINYRFKAELDRVVKSYPILSRESYEKSLSQQVGDQ